MTIINEKGAFDIRAATSADLPYILNSWMRTYEKSPAMNFPGMIRDEYFRHTHLLLDELISRSSRCGGLLVCHHTGAPHMIRGFLCGEVYTNPDIAYLHWVGVKKPEWGKGVASALMECFKKDFQLTPDQNILYTHGSNAITNKAFKAKVADKHNLVYWPWFTFTSQPPGWETGKT